MVNHQAMIGRLLDQQTALTSSKELSTVQGGAPHLYIS